jgi:hypothetical protein
MTYLRLTGLQAGLLINFNVTRLKDGFERIVNGYIPSASPRLRVNQSASSSIRSKASQ